MHELHDLREMLCKELKEYGMKGDLSAGTLDIVDKLCHAIKNLDKIIEVDGSEYSGRSYRDYSRRSEIASRLRSMASEAPDERTRHEMRSLASRMEM